MASRKPRLPPPRSVRTVERNTDRDPVEVFCRIRPPENDVDICVTVVNSRTVKLTPPNSSIAFRNGTAKEQLYKFQYVFGTEKSQKDIFDHVAKPLVSDLLAGKNGLLFAYGVTGSGKTYTMTGTPQDGGIVRRTLDVIFNSIQEYQAKKFVFKPDRMNGFDGQSDQDASLDRLRSGIPGNVRVTRQPRSRREGNSSQDNSQRVPDSSRVSSVDEDNVYSIFVAYIEIYNNYIYDLLEDAPDSALLKSLQTKILREDANHNMYVHGCTEVEVKSPEEALEALAKGQKRRKVAHTRLNCESSRSHSIFSIRVVQAPLDLNGELAVTDKMSMTVSQLSLVDLAGSERQGRTKAAGDRIKEAGNINNSLMTLRSCIEALRENQQSGGSKMVPYRDSKLTHYFKNYFDGEGKVKMVVCVNPKADDFDETMPVMKFAELAAEVSIQRTVAATPDLGLPVGRRRANQLMKEVRRRLEEEGENIKELELDIMPVFAFAPNWPQMVSGTATVNWLELSMKLRSFLLRKLQERQRIDIKENVLGIRKILVDMEKQNCFLRAQNSTYRGLYDDTLSKVRALESKVMSAEAANESLQHQLVEYNGVMTDYAAACQERDTAKSQGNLDRHRMAAKMKSRLELERDRLVQDMTTKLLEQREQLKSQMFQKQVRALQEMFGEQEITPVEIKPRPRPQQELSASPEQDLAGPAIGNVRHRRSLSQGANWVEHRPDNVLDPGTVMQPVFKKRRSVSRLQKEDVLGHSATNYCLTTQEQDSQGGLETKLYKGDIVPTATGGARVILQDVEILSQRDPTNTPSHKRQSDGYPKVVPSALQERCAVGIQGVGVRPAVPRRARF